jgi:lycopene beta-cyclase
MRAEVLLILGGGCAGLSLAMRLAAEPIHYKKVIILEQREQYTNDKTWCFWAQSDSRLLELTTHQWSKFQVSTAEHELLVDCSEMPYSTIPSTSFYEFALNKIRQSDKTEIHLGTSITNIEKSDGGSWQVETNRGSFTGDFIIDSRPTKESDIKPTLWQSFYGLEIYCKAVKMSSVAPHLMDFLPEATDGINFSYILPLADHRWLLETTVFGKNIVSKADLTERQAQLVNRVTDGSEFDVMRSEYGALPMGGHGTSSKRQPNYIQVGLSFGAIRASSGYAFQRIQKWADECYLNITRGFAPIEHKKDPWRTRLMDNLFLEVIARNPHLAPDIFLKLFKENKPTRVIRFLSDKGTVADELSIIRSLPADLFLSTLKDRLFRYFSRSII